MHQEELIAEDPMPLQGSTREVSSFFKKCRVSLSNCSLGGFEAPDVLLIPFYTHELELYPGNLLRDRLKAQQ